MKSLDGSDSTPIWKTGDIHNRRIEKLMIARDGLAI
nr:MAG TPA: hypothetical protein [Caudoviricetes sp.]